MALTAENTRALNAVSEMTAAQRGLEAGLTKTRKTMFVDPVLQRRQVRFFSRTHSYMFLLARLSDVFVYVHSGGLKPMLFSC